MLIYARSFDINLLKKTVYAGLVCSEAWQLVGLV